nr:shikimate O-hydroxycinnamoyltransferase [Tanacetum cinerariifolium]
MYVSVRVDIFDMVDINLFTMVALNIMVLKVGYTEHGVTALDSYLRAPWFRATLEEINDEPAGSIATNKTKKMLLLTWHECSETPKEHVFDYVTPRSLPQADCILTPPADESVITYTQLSGVQGVDTQSYVLPIIKSHFSDINLSFVSQQVTASQVIDDVMRQLSFDETELDGEAGFADVAGNGVDSSGPSRDESFRVDDLDLNLNEEPDVNLNVSQVETQFKLFVSEEPDVGRTQESILAEVSIQEPIMAEVSTQETIVAEVSTQVPIVAKVSTEAPIVKEVGTQDFNVEDVVLEDYVSSREDVTRYNDAGTDDDVDVDKDFLVDKENEIVKPDVDVHLFGISMDLSFDNIGVTNLVPDDVLEGEDVDVINSNGFNSEHGNDKESNYRKRKLAESRTEMEGSGYWKYSFYTGHKFSTLKEAKDRVYLHSIKSRKNLKRYKNDGVRIRARCDGKVSVFTMSHGDGPTGQNHGMKPGPSGSSGLTTSSKKRKNTCINAESQASSSGLDAHDKGDLYPWVFGVSENIRFLKALKLGFRACRRDLLGLDGAFMKGPFPGQVLVAVGLDSNNGIYPLAYALVEVERINLMKDKVSQEEEEVSLNNSIGKQIGAFVDMLSEAVEQRIDANVPDEIDGAKGKHVPNHVVKKGNLEFLVCKEIANPGVNELVDKGRPLKRKRVPLSSCLVLYAITFVSKRCSSSPINERLSSIIKELENELTSREELAVLQVEFADMKGQMQQLMEELKKIQKCFPLEVNYDSVWGCGFNYVCYE